MIPALNYKQKIIIKLMKIWLQMIGIMAEIINL